MSDQGAKNNTPRSVEDKLRDELELMKIGCIIEVASRNRNVFEYMKHWEDRCEKAEARLSEAIEQLERASARLWVAGVHAQAREIDRFLAPISHESNERIASLMLGSSGSYIP